MEEFKTASDILEFAIDQEQQAHDFYMDLAAKMAGPSMKKVFEGFAIEEMGHKMKLQSIVAGELEMSSAGSIPDLKLADYLVASEPAADMTYQDAIILAMKKEKAAYRLYLDLASAAIDEAHTELFISLAQQEANHKLRFELEYDNEILKED